MKTLSVRQPWAWLICNAGKDCENRDWAYKCRERGWCLIHASKGMTKAEYEEAVKFAREIAHYTGHIPAMIELKRGGIVGQVHIDNHVTRHDSPWFTGPSALVLSRAYPLPFQPCTGQLGFFEAKF